MARSLPRTGPSPVHRIRYAKNKHLGLSAEEIAKQEKVSLRCVEDSIALVELHHGLFNLKEVEASQAEIIVLNSDVQSLAIRRGLTAQKIIRDEAGKVVAKEPDLETQLETLKIEAQILSSLERKSSVHQNITKVQMGVGVTNAPSASVGAQSFENRLREISRKRIEAGDPQPAALPEGANQIEEVTPDWDEEEETEVSA